MTNLLSFVVLVGVLIFVHELGHFLFLKLFDVKVLRFSLGFGPRLFAVRGGETEYQIAWMPLGGYVKMLGEDPRDSVGPEDAGRAFHEKPLWQRVIAIFAGPAFNLILPVPIYFLFFAGQTELAPARIGTVLRGTPADRAGLEPGDRVVAVDGDDVRYWDELQSRIAASPGRELVLEVERDQKTHVRKVTPEAQVLRGRLGLTERVGRIGISPRYYLPQIGISDAASPAARAGLRTGDRITALNGARVRRWSDVERVLERNRGEPLRVAYLRARQVLDVVDVQVHEPGTALVVPEPAPPQDGTATRRFEAGIESAEFFVHEVEPGSPAAVAGLRPGDRITKRDGQPLRHWEMLLLALEERQHRPMRIAWVPFGGDEREAIVRQVAKVVRDEYGQEKTRWLFGASPRLLWESEPPAVIEGRFGYALGQALGKTAEAIQVTALGFVQLVRGKIPRETVGGPIMIYYAAGVAARKGWDHYLWMLAIISVNLGLINLLPIPILDGGALLFLGIEVARQRPIATRVREISQIAGIVLLLGLMIFALTNDVVRYWLK